MKIPLHHRSSARSENCHYKIRRVKDQENGNGLTKVNKLHIRGRSAYTTIVHLVDSIRILAARSTVLFHPRAHKGSGDRPLRCIRVPRREVPPPLEARGHFRWGGCGFVNKKVLSWWLVCGSDGRAVAHGARAAGWGPRADDQVRQTMDLQSYIARLWGADRLHTQ